MDYIKWNAQTLPEDGVQLTPRVRWDNGVGIRWLWFKMKARGLFNE